MPGSFSILTAACNITSQITAKTKHLFIQLLMSYDSL